MSDRVPLHNSHAEQSVLGSMFRDNQMIPDVLRLLPSAEYFYTDANQKIFRAIVELHQKNNPADLVTVANLLHNQGFIEDIGGPVYLAELWDIAPTAANAEYYAAIVRNHGLVRFAASRFTDLLRECYEPGANADAILGQAERELLSLAVNGVATEVQPIRVFVKEALGQHEAMSQPGHKSGGLPFGLVKLDELTSGMHPGEFIVVAGRPGGGKTALSLFITRHVSQVCKTPVYFASLEQAGIELASRLLCMHCSVDSLRWRKGKLHKEEYSRVSDRIQDFEHAPVYISDRCFDLTRICANAKRLKIRHNIGLMIVDYLQLIDPENRRIKRHEQIGEISRRLKLLARDMRIPVIALAQLNRESDNRAGGEPMLSDLREGGGQEQDADMVLMLYPDPKSDQDKKVQKILCKIPKQRHGPIGTVPLAFEKAYMRFENLAIEPGYGEWEENQ